MTTLLERPAPPALAFDGPLRGLRAGAVQAWGALEALALVPERPEPRPQFVAPLRHLKLAGVPSYGTVDLENTAERGLLVVPMHVGFFQEGAQNHATARALVLDAGEVLRVDDAFCVQQAQGGLLKEAQQRFLMLPLGLRPAALAQRGSRGCGRLWEEIDAFTRQYGVARGGHLERFLRPYFPRLQPLRHAFEALPEQVGAAYFVAGRLVGVEVAPNADYWAELAPVLVMYGYGPAALLAEDRGHRAPERPLDLEGLADLDDLAGRLAASRREQAGRYAEEVRRAQALAADAKAEGQRHGLDVATLIGDDWNGQVVSEGTDTVYLSLFRRFSARTLDGPAVSL
jgi:hypothetical protein